MSARNLEIHAAGQVNFPATVPTFVWQTGEWATLTDTGVGDVLMTFNAAQGVDIAECIWSVTPMHTAARITVSATQTTDLACQIQVYDEATAGLIDVPFSVVVWRRNIV